MRYAFAGDRKLSCDLLKFIIDKGYKPEALFVSGNKSASHSKELIEISSLSKDKIFVGSEFKLETTVSFLKALELDYIFGIHFPYIIPKTLLEIPKVGFLNLHPAYLPYNKGWHTPSWAIIDKTPYGATLHFMEESLDEGDIINQKQISIASTDTANSLYKKVLALEKEVFIEAFDSLLSLNPPRMKQECKGTSHIKKDLKEFREIVTSETVEPLALIDKLRGLTTNDKNEAAYFFRNGKKIGVQIELFELE